MVSKKKRSSPKLRLIFRKFKRFFRPKSGGLQKKKKKVFTAMETNFSAEIVRFRLVGGGMHPEMETDFSKWRMIFRPKSLVLGWWGGCIPLIPPPKSATAVRLQLIICHKKELLSSLSSKKLVLLRTSVTSANWFVTVRSYNE